MSASLLRFAFLPAVALATIVPSWNNISHAGVISGESSAYGVELNLGISVGEISVITAGLGPFSTSSGTAPVAYNIFNDDDSASALGALDVGGALGTVNFISLDTGLLETTSVSNVDGGLGGRSTTASASVNDVSLSILSLVGVDPAITAETFISLEATAVESDAAVSGDFNALSESGSTTIAGVGGVGETQAVLSVLGVEFVLDASAPANTLISIDSTVSGLASLQGSISVILNEQLYSGDSLSSRSIDVNAIHVTFSDVGVNLGALGIGLLNGDVIISHSEAQMSALDTSSAVPEPSSFVLLGIAALGALSRLVFRRRKQSSEQLAS
ncbi:PEP-CTERM sorting domain-containing protein [Thalassoglobus polymorphus]|uniref:Ice-binding protein C-terminal domain-containing protein n=1 Tax=Thalassoglobus polymorphus TaxID=2527994 RepID=A0A517QLF1_9PLAN|nr:PEP-CTERM sorting domain-containing protein [Thalassoglobus polymorphus]QDT32478.1 hypothetical protein Mal48_17240 [Thalassoglobus polymorphus]